MPYELVEDTPQAGPKGRYQLVPVDETPAVVSAGQALNDIPRQLGLTARYALTGPAKAAQIVTEPLRYLTDRATGMTGKTAPLGVEAGRLADWIGLPAPQTPTERVVGDATELVAGAGGLTGGARAASALPGMVGKVMSGLAANPVAQLSGAAGAGAAGGASREAGGGPLEQGLASLVGGVAGNFAPAYGGLIAQAARLLTRPAMTAQQIDVQLSSVLQRQGVDYSKIPDQVKGALRRELADAMNAGKELDPAAVSRLADFKTVGAIPTRGMLSQDPVQITREMNLAKMAANSADNELHGLPLMQNKNNATLIRNLNDAGAARGDPFSAGQSAIGAITARDAAEAARVSGMYRAARTLPGGETALERTSVVNGIYDALNRENKLAFLPENIGKMLNSISRGQTTINGQTFHVPFDAKAYENLQTMLSTAARTTSGNEKAAVIAARKALEAQPLTPVNRQLATTSTVPITAQQAAFLRGGDAAPQQYIAALNEARAAHAGRMGWQEASRPVEASVAGAAAPDNFVKRFVLGGTLDDAAAVAREAPAAPVKEAILAHLKSKALNSAADEVGKFSPSAYNKAMDAIGDRKLALFFAPDELAQLRSVGRVGSLMMAQPIGSAVNNSNSGALLLGQGMDAFKWLAGKVPFGQAAILDPLRNINLSISQSMAQNVAPSLVRRPVLQPSAPLLLPAAALGGGLLSIPE